MIDSRILFQFFVNIVMFSIGGFCLDYSSYQTSLFAMLGTMQLVFNILMLRSYHIKWFSFSMIFVIATYLFHFGNLLLIWIGQEDYCAWNILQRSYSIADFNKSCLFSLACSGMVVTGIMLAYLNYKKKTPAKHVDNLTMDKLETEKAKICGLILFAVTVIPSVYLQWSRINIILQGGLYSETRSVDSEMGLLFLLTRFFPFAIMLLIIGFKKKRKISTIIFFLAVVYEIICMMSGNRSLQLTAIISYSFIYYKVVLKSKPIKPITLIIGAVLVYFGSLALNILMRIRNFGMSSMDIDSVFDLASGTNPLFGVLGEFGITLFSVSLAFTNYPMFVPFKYGSSYFLSAFSPFAFLGGIFNNIQKEYVYVNDFSAYGLQFTLGGSYIGELYANFAWLGAVAAILVGIFIGITCKSIFMCIEEAKWNQLVLLMVLFYFNIFWVRNFFYGFVFTFFWFCIYEKFVGGFVSYKLTHK